ncbi:TerB family tellurite resistance protein [Flavobacteriaceae bacterium TP-CH-4]|uniref:TerB family tellurite resistance protein n=1 Tax=Pelagihabitans pacificus TaxID=2696054 RepID=A0A967AVB0_9FLAO|nr:TerB family tellurite resistance protein [Pelagihabitans pacificus]NHF60607.1 TerB family tellurite resistance protein [Pelagihabitans pacificus]
MKFDLAEKLAIVKVIDSIIIADEVVHNGEINALSRLMLEIGFDSNFIADARNIDTAQGMQILIAMPEAKKKALAAILEDVAKSDGFVHEKEQALMTSILTDMGIGQNPNN